MKIDWSWLVPVLVSLGAALIALSQVVLGRRGNRLAESADQGDVAKAWAALVDEWRLALLVAGHPTAATRDESAQYHQVLARYRDARISFVNAMDNGGREASASGDHPQLDRAIADELEAVEALGTYRAAVERVLEHLAEVADRVVRRRLTVAAAYAALGRDIVRARPALRRLLAISADSDGCPGSSWPEVRGWQSLTLDEVSLRVGWGDALEPHRGTAARIYLLEDLLADYAVRIGDAGHVGHFTLASYWDEDLADLASLPEVWRGTRPVGRWAALRWTWRAAGVAFNAMGRLGRRPSNPRVTETLLAAFEARRPQCDPRWLAPLDVEEATGPSALK
ncbi:hypothetical protein GCM10027451_27800 [Geodermatophilus aquaeductus]|uniref:Uncharacterized protein n=1 Tax=Geodermatophilus aquaeductus TaxID=1564161 RepID=A0A521F9R1_9ACTN|nr:hypothetical protein [Geodermatophilus aquaeductus]SMO92351.1 hypothetical protein SAMN06273567_107178 [Geodermatophilus aquaeductus]